LSQLSASQVRDFIANGEDSREHQVIRRIGPDKGGHWEILEP
jgi:hypothetical protein